MPSKSKSRASARTRSHRPTIVMQDVVEALGTTESVDDPQAWRLALLEADAAALRVLVGAGAVADNNSFYVAVSDVADHFGYSKLDGDLDAAIIGLGEGVDQMVAVNDAADAREGAQWRGAYALGLAVGLRLAGGAR